MFNPDGSLRFAADAVTAEPPVEPAPAAPEPAAAAVAAEPPAEAAAEPAPVSKEPAEAAPAPSESRDPERPGEPSMFSDLIVNLASQAAMYLGLVDNPLAPKVPPDLPAARQMIEILAMLKEKTRGNLTSDENVLLERILTDLRMQYVSMTATRR